MKEMLIVYSPLGIAICVVDAVHGIEDRVKAALENRYKTEVLQMPSCSLHPWSTEMELEVPMANGTSVKIKLEKVPYYQ